MIVNGNNLNKPYNSVITYILCYTQLLQFTEEEYNLIKEKVGLDPLLLTLNKMWDEINKHDDLKDNPLSR